MYELTFFNSLNEFCFVVNVVKPFGQTVCCAPLKLSIFYVFFFFICLCIPTLLSWCFQEAMLMMTTTQRFARCVGRTATPTLNLHIGFRFERGRRLSTNLAMCVGQHSNTHSLVVVGIEICTCENTRNWKYLQRYANKTASMPEYHTQSITCLYKNAINSLWQSASLNVKSHL